MSYMALYRKFRPQTFDQVKGQEHVIRTLENQIKNNRIGHAYLFTGTRGTGKTSVAKLFAKAVNCLNPVNGEPCNECENCRAIAQDSFIDVVEVDAASNTGVDDIRRIIEEVNYTPVRGKYKVYIIDEAHMLSNQAFNAFLKTLEEPPSYVVFILATTEPYKIPITILSRTQRYDFHRISNETLSENLKEIVDHEGVEADEKALRYIARAGDGSMRDSISLLDKCISFNLGEALTYERVLDTLGAVDTDIFSRMFRTIYAGNAHEALTEVDRAIADGRDLGRFISDFTWYLRNLLLLNADPETDADTFGISNENMEALKEDAAAADPEVLMRYIRILSQLLNDIRGAASRQILIEVALIKLARPQMESDVASLADRVRQLENTGVRMADVNAGQQYGSIAHTQENRTVDVPKATAAPEPQAPVVREQPEPEQVSTAQSEEEYYASMAGAIYDAEPIEPIKPVERPQAAVTANGPAGIVVNSWPDIVNACSGRLLKAALGRSNVIADSDESVMIYVSGQMAAESIRSQLRTVEDNIKKVTGCDVRADVRSGDYNDALKGSTPKKEFSPELLKNINFNIRMED